jgi:ribonuclease T2
MFRSLPTRLVIVLVGFLLLSLSACDANNLRDVENTLSDSATLVSALPDSQSTTVAKAVTPTKKPTRSPKVLTPTPTSGKRVKNTPGDFDFYVLSLSWSPDYCASNDDPQQCSLGKKLAFVLHGLWPQYQRGYPADCSTVRLPKNAQQQFPNLYPSTKLYTHEWDKHGTCSGLQPLDFLALSKELKESISIPKAYRSPAKSFRTTLDDLKAAFVAANATLSEDALAVQCSGSGRFLQEVRVCLSREGEPLPCSDELLKSEAKSCAQADFLVRNVK